VDVTLVNWHFGAWLLATLRRTGETAALLTGYVLLGLSLIVFLRRPGNPAANAFVLLNAALVGVTLVTGTLPVTWPEGIVPAARALAGPAMQSLLFGVLLPTILLRFALVFPRPKPIVLRRPWLAHAPIVISLLVVLLTRGSSVAWFWFLGSLVLMVALLAHNGLTMRDAVSRAQIRWGLGGLIFGFGTITLLLIAGTLGWVGDVPQEYFDAVAALAFIIIGLTLSVAITRYRLFDIDVLIRRTLVYSVLTAVLAWAYFASVLVLEGLFRRLTGEGQNSLVIVISTLAIAALFAPLRRRIQADIDRRFYRHKYDAARALAHFGARARDEVELDRLNDTLLAVVLETMQPAHASFWLVSPHTKRQPGAAETDARRSMEEVG
jgi:hypothetical protein